MLFSAKDFGYVIARDYKTYSLVSCPYHNDNHPSGLFFKKNGHFKCLGCGKNVNHADGKAYIGTDEEQEFLLPHSLGLFKSTENYLEGTSPTLSEDLIDYMGTRGIEPRVLFWYGCREKSGREYPELIMPQRDFDNKVTGTVNRPATFAKLPRRYFIHGHRFPCWPSKFFKPDKKTIFVSEGGIKSMAIFQTLEEIIEDEDELAGYASVATMGSLWTKEMEEVYSQMADRIVFIADNDEAGIAFARHFKEIGARAFVVKKPFDNMTQEERNVELQKILGKVNKNGFKKLTTIPTSMAEAW